MSSPTSKYPTSYWSESKKASIRIEDMATPHIANALRKISGGPTTSAEVDRMRKAMTQELFSRGCVWDPETGQWAFPPKPGDDADKEGT